MTELAFIVAGACIAFGIAMAAANASQRRPVNAQLVTAVVVLGLVIAVIAAATSGIQNAIGLVTALVLAAIVAGLIVYLARQWGDPAKAQQNRGAILLLGLALVAVVLRVLDEIAR